MIKSKQTMIAFILGISTAGLFAHNVFAEPSEKKMNRSSRLFLNAWFPGFDRPDAMGNRLGLTNPGRPRAKYNLRPISTTTDTHIPLCDEPVADNLFRLRF